MRTVDLRLNSLYELGDASRLSRTLQLLLGHDISRWALTGGTAIELHLRNLGAPSDPRPFHDVDFIAQGFDCLPATLGLVLLSRHVHPHDPPGKTMLQAVDPITSVRIDVFRAYGDEMERVTDIRLGDCRLKIVSLEDLVCRHARLCCDLLRDQPLAPKFARDFLRMAEFTQSSNIDNVWHDHRRSEDPVSFAEATALLRGVIATRGDLLTPAVYSTDFMDVCPRCESTAGFRLADMSEVFAHLGYC